VTSEDPSAPDLSAPGNAGALPGADTAQVEGSEQSGPRYGRRRRAPRYGSFVVTGVVIGVVIGILLTLSRATTGEFSLNTTLSYVAAIFGLIGAVAGAGLAVLFDRRGPHPH
jgi:hypothetical protein